MRRALATAAGAFIALVIAGACGEVPTLPGGVAYITPIQLPSPTVAAGDTMRDSLGRAMPLRVYAVGRDADTIRDVTVRWLLTSLNSGATIGGDGYLVAPDSLTSLRLVAQVTSANGTTLQLQTAEVTVPVVPLADSLAPTTTDTLSTVLPLASDLSVTVTGVGPAATTSTGGVTGTTAGARGPVTGIRVRYRVAEVYPASAPALRSLFYLANGSTVLRPDSTIALDTTKSGGTASRRLVGLAPGSTDTAVDSLTVTATALSQRGKPLRGSPVTFRIRIHR
jgi:hypothetical protein